MFAPLSHGRKIPPPPAGRIWRALLALIVLAAIVAAVAWLFLPDGAASGLIGGLVLAGLVAAALYGVTWLLSRALDYSMTHRARLCGMETIAEYLKAGGLVADIYASRRMTSRRVRRTVRRAADQALWLYALEVQKRTSAESQQRRNRRWGTSADVDVREAAEVREQHTFAARAALALLQELHTTALNGDLRPDDRVDQLLEIAHRIQDADTAAARGPYGIRRIHSPRQPIPQLPDDFPRFPRQD